MLVVSHMDQLSEYSPDKHAGILFDDMDFKHMPRSAQIHIADYDQDRAIHVRYTCAVIPAGTLKVCTSNYRDVFLEDSAIQRRCRYFDLSQYNEFQS